MQKLLLVYYYSAKSRCKPNLESTSKYDFFPRFGGKKWRRSEHAHASYPGLFFSPARVQPLYGTGGKESSRTGLYYSLFVPPTFAKSIVSSFSWDLQWSQEKTKAMLMQNLGAQTKSIMVFSGMANNGCEGD